MKHFKTDIPVEIPEPQLKTFNRNIAKEMRMKIFSATRLADQLEKRNLIKREKSTTDLRGVLVSLSKKGQALIKQIDDNTLDLILDNIRIGSKIT